MDRRARRKQRREAQAEQAQLTEQSKTTDGPFGPVPSVLDTPTTLSLDPDADIGGSVRIVKTVEQARADEEAGDSELTRFKYTLSQFLSMDGPNPFVVIQELGPLHKKREWERSRARVKARIVRPEVELTDGDRESLVRRLAEDSLFFRDILRSSMATSFMALDAARDDTIDLVSKAIGIPVEQLQTSATIRSVTEDSLTDMALVQFIRQTAGRLELATTDVEALLTKHIFNRPDRAQPGN